MSELPPLDRLAHDAPLRGLAVLEIEGEFSGYAGRLLVDLGASVVRVHVAEANAVDEFDAAAAFLHRDKRNVVYEGAEQLQKLISEADVVVQSGGADAAGDLALSPIEVRAHNSHAVH